MYRVRSRVLRWLIAICIPPFVLVAFVLRVFELGRSVESQTVPTESAVSISLPSEIIEVAFPFGRGYRSESWQLYFNHPDASGERDNYHGGLDALLADAIGQTEATLDIAAFELNSEPISRAILEAYQRGVAVRIVTDDEHGLEDGEGSALGDLRAAGISVKDDGRSGLMHNKFMIMDRDQVWTGSWNYTVNGSYRNNNNALVLDDPRAVIAYQAEFEEMFSRGEFGKTSTNDGMARFPFDNGGGEISILFGSEADEIQALQAEIARAESAIRLMVFVFSLEELAEAILQRAADPAVTVQGIFEKRNSTASWSQLPALHCAGADMRQDGNRYILHHKVIIIDADTVITGSFNFSRSGAERNDENIVIIRSAAIAGLYLEEWERIWDSAGELPPGEVVCD